MSFTNVTISDAEFAKFQALIYKIAGISLADSKKVLVAGRLGKRLKHHNLDSFGDYYQLVVSGKADSELQMMVDLLTTNETYFFREQQHFDYLATEILPTHPPGTSFNIWSAASSSGEEAYTMAMVLAEHFGVGGNWLVTGTDISERILAQARTGQYPMQRARDIPPDFLRRYCLKGVRSQEGMLLVDQSLRKHTRFVHANLNQKLPELGPFDVIFLRNVMIYFDNNTKREVIARLVRQLKRGGHFIVGHSESLNGLTEELQGIKPTIYVKP